MVTVIEAYRTNASNNVTGVTPAPLLRYDRPLLTPGWRNGRRGGLKIPYRKVCGFDPRPRYQGPGTMQAKTASNPVCLLVCCRSVRPAV